MRFYLDVCSYCRPFDIQNQDRIHLETEAVLQILSNITSNNWVLIGSDVIDLEVSKIVNDYKRQKVGYLTQIATEKIYTTDEIKQRANFLQQFGIKAFDSFHIALAESAKTDYFITTDDKIIKVMKNIQTKIQICNPIYFILEEI